MPCCRKLEFKQQADLTRDKLAGVTDKNQAAVIYQQFLALLKDGHTFIQSFWGNSGSFGLMDFDVKNNICYIKNISTEFDSKLIGRKVKPLVNYLRLLPWIKLRVLFRLKTTICRTIS